MSLLKSLKSSAHALVTTKFQHGWQWKLEFANTGGANPPRDFDIYAKSIEHGGVTIETEEKQVGTNTLTSPTHKTAGDFTVMIRDNEDCRCEEFFQKLAARVVNPDGTINLPHDYLFTLRILRLNDAGQYIKYRESKVYLASYGGFTRGRDAVGEFVSYPATFKKHQAFD